MCRSQVHISLVEDVSGMLRGVELAQEKEHRETWPQDLDHCLTNAPLTVRGFTSPHWTDLNHLPCTQTFSTF